MTDTTTDKELKRVIGVTGLASNMVNITIGAGIFVLPAIVGLQLGAFGVFGYLFCGLMLAIIMLCYAEIGSRITTAGGSYAYIEAAFGNFAGFISNWLLLFGWCLLGDAALMNIIADSLAVMFPVFLNPWYRGLLFFVLISIIIFINVRGAKNGVVFVKLITLVKLLPLLGIIIFGMGKIDTANLHWEHLPSLDTFGNAALVLFFAFAGFETALGISGEIKNPKRTVPLGILTGGLLILTIYMLLQIVTQGILGAKMELVQDAPLAAVAEQIIGPIGGTVLIIAAILSCFGTVSGDVLASPRMLYAGAQNGMFPRFLGKVHPKFATPYWAIYCFGAVLFTLSVAGGFKQLAILASAAILLVYLAVILATIKMRSKKQGADEKSFKIPGGLIIPIVGIFTIVWLLTSLSKWEVLSAVIFIAAICAIYFVMKKLKKEKVPDTTKK